MLVLVLEPHLISSAFSIHGSCPGCGVVSLFEGVVGWVVSMFARTPRLLCAGVGEDGDGDGMGDDVCNDDIEI